METEWDRKGKSKIWNCVEEKKILIAVQQFLLFSHSAMPHFDRSWATQQGTHRAYINRNWNRNRLEDCSLSLSSASSKARVSRESSQPRTKREQVHSTTKKIRFFLFALPIVLTLTTSHEIPIPKGSLGITWSRRRMEWRRREKNKRKNTE